MCVSRVRGRAIVLLLHIHFRLTVFVVRVHAQGQLGNPKCSIAITLRVKRDRYTTVAFLVLLGDLIFFPINLTLVIQCSRRLCTKEHPVVPVNPCKEVGGNNEGLGIVSKALACSIY